MFESIPMSTQQQSIRGHIGNHTAIFNHSNDGLDLGMHPVHRQHHNLCTNRNSIIKIGPTCSKIF